MCKREGEGLNLSRLHHGLPYTAMDVLDAQLMVVQRLVRHVLLPREILAAH
jgi:hypothetical protein